MLENVVAGADLTVTGVGAERGLRVLLCPAVRVDIGVDVGGAHCVGVGGFWALVARDRRVLLDNYRRQTSPVGKESSLLW